MSRNHFASTGGVLVITALALTALPAAVAHRAADAAPAPAPSPLSAAVSRPAGAVPTPTPPAPIPVPTVLTPVAPPRTASTPPMPPLPPGFIEAVQRDLGLTRSQAETRIRNEIRLTAVETRLREELGGRFGGSWILGATAHTLVVATTSAADIPRIVSAGARAEVVRASLAMLRAIKVRLDQILSTHPLGGAVRYIDVRANRVVVLSRNAPATQNVVRSTGVNPDLVVVLYSRETPHPAASPSRHRGVTTPAPGR
ncbi:S1 family peptidase [Streptosporangium sp. NPDC002721]|uniref:S1 family peptidase n=1 Tax=Streptosporangium sp. NPDC002721 TaxID=3366188 RepID=UPI0036BB554A